MFASAWLNTPQFNSLGPLIGAPRLHNFFGFVQRTINMVIGLKSEHLLIKNFKCKHFKLTKPSSLKDTERGKTKHTQQEEELHNSEAYKVIWRPPL